MAESASWVIEPSPTIVGATGHRDLQGLLRFTLGLRTDLICEAKDSRPEAQKNVQHNLVGLSIAVAACSPGAFATLRGVYLLTSLGYSLFLKKKLMIDVICLAGFYTLRILSGGAATGIVISTWLMAFSMFLFLSLAFLKRYTELQAVKGCVGRLPGRGYCTEDLDIIRSLGPARRIARGQAKRRVARRNRLFQGRSVH